MNASAGLRWVFLIVLLSVQFGCAVPSLNRSEQVNMPTSPWQTASPEAQEIDPQAIARMLDYIQQQKLPVHSFLLIRGGYLVSETYFDSYSRGKTHLLYWATKSVISALVGIAIEDGYIEGTGQPVLAYFPEIKALDHDPLLEALTIEHLLTMTAGFETFIAPNPSASQDWVRAYLTQPFTSPPGSRFFYNSGASHVLAAILQKATGRPVQEYARDKLFDPLDIDSFTWQADSNKINFGNSWLELRPIDMAKLGYLYLHQGNWNGQQVVPAAWVERSVQKAVDTRGKMNAAEEDGYGYCWWMNSFGGFSAHGFAGQYIFVVPEHDMVVVFTGAFDEAGFTTGFELMKAYLLPAVDAGALQQGITVRR